MSVSRNIGSCGCDVHSGTLFLVYPHHVLVVLFVLFIPEELGHTKWKKMAVELHSAISREERTSSEEILSPNYCIREAAMYFNRKLTNNHWPRMVKVNMGYWGAAASEKVEFNIFHPISPPDNPGYCTYFVKTLFIILSSSSFLSLFTPTNEFWGEN